MIKNTYVDPLQESMEMKAYEEEFKNVAPSPYAIGLETAYMYAADIERSYNALMEQAGIAQMKYYVENGELLTPLTEEELEDKGKKEIVPVTTSEEPAKVEKKNGFFKKLAEGAIKLLQMIREKLAAAWKKVKDILTNNALANKAFVAKYGKVLSDSKIKSAAVNGYDFKGLLKNPVATFTVPSKGTGQKYDTNAALKFCRAKYLNGFDGGGENFAEDLKSFLYGNKGTNSMDVAQALTIIKNSSGTIKQTGKNYATADKNLKELINKLEKDKEHVVESDITLFKAYGQDLNTICNVYSKACADMSRQAKAVCVAALAAHKKFKKDSEAAGTALAVKKESADLRSLSVEDILATTF